MTNLKNLIQTEKQPKSTINGWVIYRANKGYKAVKLSYYWPVDGQSEAEALAITLQAKAKKGQTFFALKEGDW